MEFPHVDVLSQKEIQDIHDNALRILEEIGFSTDSQDVVQLMRNAGAREKGNEILVPHRFVDKSLDSAPKSFKLYTPTGSLCETIGEGKPIILSGHQAVFVLDYGCDEPRPGRKQDVVNFTRVANAIEDIDGIAVPLYPQEVLKHSSLVHAMESILTYAEKPLFFAPERGEAFETICDLARVASGKEDLGKEAFLIVQPSPISPLFWVKGSAQCVFGAAKKGIPCIVLHQIIPGMSGPVTLAGTLALHHAESLLGLVITQLVNPGTPVIYPGAWVTFDMAGGGIDIGAPEKYLLSIASAQLARYLGIPSMAAGPDTNSHLLDIQNGIEKTFSATADILSRTDVVVNAGMLSNALTVSLEQVVIDAEIFSMLKRMNRGIEVNEQTLAFEVIKRVGVKGEFLTDTHTLEHFRYELWDTRHPLFQRDKFDKWKESGAVTVIDCAHEQVEKILTEHPRTIPDKNQLKRMAEIVLEFDRRYGKGE